MSEKLNGFYEKEIAISPAAAGIIDWTQIKHTFRVIENHVLALEEEVKGLKQPRTVFVRTVLLEGGTETILEPRDHLNCRLVKAFVQVADNLKMENTVEVPKLTEPKTLKAGEKSGKAQSMVVNEHRNVSRYEEIFVTTTSVRKTILVTTWREI